MIERLGNLNVLPNLGDDNGSLTFNGKRVWDSEEIGAVTQNITDIETILKNNIAIKLKVVLGTGGTIRGNYTSASGLQNTLNRAGTFNCRWKSPVNLSAIANTGFEFDHWELTDGELENNDTESENGIVSIPCEDTNLTAYFKLKKSSVHIDPAGGVLPYGVSYYATLDANNLAMVDTTQVSTTPSGITTAINFNAIYGTSVTIPRPAKDGYTFLGWRQFNGDVDTGLVNNSTDTHVFTVGLNDVRFVAQWAENVFQVSFDQNTSLTLKDSSGETLSNNSTEAFFNIAPSTSPMKNPYADGTYIYADGVDETRYPIGWSFDSASTSPDIDFDDTVTALDLAEHAGSYTVTGGTAYYTIPVYLVWSANYYGLETATLAFQNKYFSFTDTAKEHNRFYTHAPSQCKLPAGSSDAGYQYNGEEQSRLEYRVWYTTPQTDAPDWFTAYGTGKYAGTGSNIYYAGFSNSADSEIGKIGSNETIDDTDLTENRTSDFTNASLNGMLNSYMTYTLPLVAIVAHTGENLYTATVENQSTLNSYANALNASVSSVLTSFLNDLVLEPVDPDAKDTVANILTRRANDPAMQEASVTNECADGAVTLHEINPTTHVTTESVLTKFGEIESQLPPCETNREHSFDSLVTLCEAVFAPYKTGNTYDFTTEQSSSKYTKESVAALYTLLYEKTNSTMVETDGGLYGVIYNENGTVRLKVPSMYRYDLVVAQLAEAYHGLAVKTANFDELSQKWKAYMTATWGVHFGNLSAVDDNNNSVTIGNDALTKYFTTDSVNALMATLNLYNTYEGQGWSIVEQNAIDGMGSDVVDTSGNSAPTTRTCASTTLNPYSSPANQPYYTLTGNDAALYNYAEGTLADTLLDAIDALVPILEVTN